MKELDSLSILLNICFSHSKPVWRETGRFADDDLTAIVAKLTTLVTALDTRPLKPNIPPKPVAFSKANLSWANLSGANLLMADLSEADLSQANLSQAILWGTDLSEANLTETNLRQASYNGDTTWLAGFDPDSAGMVKSDG